MLIYLTERRKEQGHEKPTAVGYWRESLLLYLILYLPTFQTENMGTDIYDGIRTSTKTTTKSRNKSEFGYKLRLPERRIQLAISICYNDTSVRPFALCS